MLASVITFSFSKVERISSLVPHVQIVDEVAMGTCIILAHVYFRQLTHVCFNYMLFKSLSCDYHVTLLLQLTPVGAAMLADGAVMHLLDYFQFDCPDNHGSFVTVEALGRLAPGWNHSCLHIVHHSNTGASSKLPAPSTHYCHGYHNLHTLCKPQHP